MRLLANNALKMGIILFYYEMSIENIPALGILA